MPRRRDSASTASRPGRYLATQFGVILHYLRLTVLPFGQTFDYDWPLASIAAPLAVLVPMVVLIALVVAAWRVRATQPLVDVRAGWVLMTLALTSSIMPIADLAVERRMYLPLVGLMLLAAAWLHDACQSAAGRVGPAPRAHLRPAHRRRWSRCSRR